MTNRIGPMDQGTLGKIGTKVDEAGTSNKVATDKAVTDKAPASPASANDTVNLTSSAKLLERLDKTLASLPEVNSSRRSGPRLVRSPRSRQPSRTVTTRLTLKQSPTP